MSASHAQHEPRCANFTVAVTRTLPVQHARAAAFVPCRSQLHPGIYKIALLCWAMLLAVFWATFAISCNALFMVAIGTVYATVFFSVPFILSRIAGARSSAAFSLSNFARGRFDTLYGPIGGLEALLQVIMVPFALTVGGIAIGFIIHAARMAN